MLEADKYQPAAFGRLCVETNLESRFIENKTQPPSGGCVLKPPTPFHVAQIHQPAAFGRLCVETR